MQATNRNKSKIFKVLVTKEGVTRDYAVQAYENTINYALRLVAERLDVNEDDVQLITTPYPMKVLQSFWANPSLLFIREKETISEDDTSDYRLDEQIQLDLNALLRPEPAKRISEGNFYVIKDIAGRKVTTDEVKFRPFYSSVGIGKDGLPMRTKPSEPRNRGNKAFYTDTNDVIYDDPNTIIVPNTDYIFPVKVKGSTLPKILATVFRFASSHEAYLDVRNRIESSGLANVPCRFFKELTYLEICDSWLCGTGVSMGKEANPEVVAKNLAEIMKTKSELDGRKLKYPKLPK